MERARRHHRLLAFLAFGLLALVAELVGRSLTHRIDIGRHVQSPGYAGADYYPFLLAGAKIGIALLLARLAWRVVRARRLIAAVGRLHGEGAPRVRLRLSPRLWLAVFVLTALIYLAQAHAEGVGGGVFYPWLHSSALPIFAVLAVLVAFVWGAVERWLSDYERYAERAVAAARRLVATAGPRLHAAEASLANPRRLFGLAFESRPPPLAV
jgi:hypothetical protein